MSSSFGYEARLPSISRMTEMPTAPIATKSGDLKTRFTVVPDTRFSGTPFPLGSSDTVTRVLVPDKRPERAFPSTVFRLWVVGGNRIYRHLFN